MADDKYRWFRKAELLKYPSEKKVVDPIFEIEDPKYPDNDPRGQKGFEVEYNIPPDADTVQPVILFGMVKVEGEEVVAQKDVELIEEPPLKIEVKLEDEAETKYTTEQLTVPSGSRVNVRATLPEGMKFDDKKLCELTLAASIRGQNKADEKTGKVNPPKIKVFDPLRGTLKLSNDGRELTASYDVIYEDYVKAVASKISSWMKLWRKNLLDIYIEAKVLTSDYVQYAPLRIKIVEGKGFLTGRLLAFGFDVGDLTDESIEIYATDEKEQQRYGDYKLTSAVGLDPNNHCPAVDFKLDDLPKDIPLKVVAKINDRDVFTFEGSHMDPEHGDDGHGARDWISGDKIGWYDVKNPHWWSNVGFVPKIMGPINRKNVVVPVYAGQINAKVKVMSSDPGMANRIVGLPPDCKVYVREEGQDNDLGVANYDSQNDTWEISKLPLFTKLVVYAEHEDYFGEDDEGNPADVARHTSKSGSDGLGNRERKPIELNEIHSGGVKARTDVIVPLLGGTAEVKVVGYDGRKLLKPEDGQLTDDGKIHDKLNELRENGRLKTRLNELIAAGNLDVDPVNQRVKVFIDGVAKVPTTPPRAPSGRERIIHLAYNNPRFVDDRYFIDGIPLPFRDCKIKVVHLDNRHVPRVGTEMRLDQEGSDFIDVLPRFEKDSSHPERSHVNIVLYVDLYSPTTKATIVGETFVRPKPTMRKYVEFDALKDVKVELFDNNDNFLWKDESRQERDKEWFVHNVFCNYELYGELDTENPRDLIVQVPVHHVSGRGNLYTLVDCVMYDRTGGTVRSVYNAGNVQSDVYRHPLKVNKLGVQEYPVFGPNFEYKFVGKGSVAGTVFEIDARYNDRRPIPHALVWFTDERGNEVRGLGRSKGIQTDENGNYTFTDVPVGKYIVHAERVGSSGKHTDYSGATPIEITPATMAVTGIKVPILYSFKLSISKPEFDELLDNSVSSRGYYCVLEDWTWKGEIKEKMRSLDNVKDHVYPFAHKVEWYLLDENGNYLKVKDLIGAGLRVEGEGGPVTLPVNQNNPCEIVVPENVGKALVPGKEYIVRFAVTTMVDGMPHLVSYVDQKFKIVDVAELTGSIEGNVIYLDKEKRGIGGAKVTVVDSEGNVLGQTTSEGNTGHFKVEDLPLRKELIVKAEFEQMSSDHTQPYGSDGKGGRVPVVLTSRELDRENVRVTLHSPKGTGTIIGQVSYATGGDMAGVTVTAAGDDDQIFSQVVSNSEGNFVLENVPLNQQILVHAIDKNGVMGMHIDPLFGSDGRGGRDFIVLNRSDATRDGVKIRLYVPKGKGFISGIVKDVPENKPVANAKVDALDENDKVLATGTSDERGTFFLANVPCGVKVAVRAIHGPGYGVHTTPPSGSDGRGGKERIVLTRKDRVRKKVIVPLYTPKTERVPKLPPGQETRQLESGPETKQIESGPERKRITAGEKRLALPQGFGQHIHIAWVNHHEVPPSAQGREKFAYAVDKDHPFRAGKHSVIAEVMFTVIPTGNKAKWKLSGGILRGSIEGEITDIQRAAGSSYYRGLLLIDAGKTSGLREGNYTLTVMDEPAGVKDSVTIHLMSYENLQDIDLGEIKSLKRAADELGKPDEDLQLVMAFVKSCYQNGKWNHVPDPVTRYPFVMARERLEGFQSRKDAVERDYKFTTAKADKQTADRCAAAYKQFIDALNLAQKYHDRFIANGEVVKILQEMFDYFAENIKNPNGDVLKALGVNVDYVNNFLTRYQIAGEGNMHGKWLEKLSKDWFTTHSAGVLWQFGEKYFHAKMNTATNCMVLKNKGLRGILHCYFSALWSADTSYRLLYHMFRPSDDDRYDEDAIWADYERMAREENEKDKVRLEHDLNENLRGDWLDELARENATGEPWKERDAERLARGERFATKAEARSHKQKRLTQLKDKLQRELEMLRSMGASKRDISALKTAIENLTVTRPLIPQYEACKNIVYDSISAIKGITLEERQRRINKQIELAYRKRDVQKLRQRDQIMHDSYERAANDAQRELLEIQNAHEEEDILRTLIELDDQINAALEREHVLTHDELLAMKGDERAARKARIEANKAVPSDKQVKVRKIKQMLLAEHEMLLKRLKAFKWNRDNRQFKKPIQQAIGQLKGAIENISLHKDLGVQVIGLKNYVYDVISMFPLPSAAKIKKIKEQIAAAYEKRAKQIDAQIAREIDIAYDQKRSAEEREQAELKEMEESEELLHLIEKYDGDIRKACEKAGIDYDKMFPRKGIQPFGRPGRTSPTHPQ